MQIKVQFLTFETGLAAQMRVCVSPSKKKKTTTIQHYQTLPPNQLYIYTS